MLLGTISHVIFLGSVKNILTWQQLNLSGTSYVSDSREAFYRKAQQGEEEWVGTSSRKNRIEKALAELSLYKEKNTGFTIGTSGWEYQLCHWLYSLE